MISKAGMKQTVAKMLEIPDGEVVDMVLSGVLAGIALAVKDPKFARTIDHQLRTQWNTSHGPSIGGGEGGLLYGPGMMAARLTKQFAGTAGVSNN